MEKWIWILIVAIYNVYETSHFISMLNATLSRLQAICVIGDVACKLTFLHVGNDWIAFLNKIIG